MLEASGFQPIYPPSSLHHLHDFTKEHGEIDRTASNYKKKNYYQQRENLKQASNLKN